MDKQQFITGIKASIAEIFERSRDKWVSVREPGASFSAILAANGVNKKYTPPLFDVLTKNGLIERESVGTGVRYRYQSRACTTPDLDKLAEKVYEALCSYNAARRTDGRPKRVTPPRDVSQNGNVKRFEGKLLPNIGDSRYILHADCGPVQVVEVKIIGIMRDITNGRYTFNLAYRLSDEDDLVYTNDVPLRDLFTNPEDIFAHLQRTMIRFHGELFPTIKRETVKQNGR